LTDKGKTPCLFFDQINNNANLRRMSRFDGRPSTDLSTVIVDKYVQSPGNRQGSGREAASPLSAAGSAHMMRGPVFGIDI
jgi:hypothetical protein